MVYARKARHIVLGICLSTLALAARSGQLPPPAPGAGPGAPQAPLTGSSAVSGVVIDGTTKQPIAGAIVQLTLGARGAIAPTRVVSDSKGRFVFTGLAAAPAGYAFAATKFGYATEAASGRGAAEPLAPVGPPLSDGEWAADATVVLWRLSSISGTVIDEKGEPVVDVPVRLLVRVPIAGFTRLAAGPITKTDDRGAYRLPGLSRGSYLVTVPSVQSAVPGSTPEVTIGGTTTEAVQRDQALAANQLGRGGALPNTQGLDVGSSRLIIGNYATPPPSRGRAQAYPVLFHPNARSVTRATPIELAYGQERQGVDFQLQPVPTFMVSGRVTGPPGAAAGMVLRLMPDGSEDLGVGSEQATALSEDDGRFTFVNVPSGSYILDARRTVTELSRGAAIMVGLPATPGFVSLSGSGSSIPSAPDGTLLSTRYTTGNDSHYGRLRVEVGNADQSNVTLALRPTTTVTGRFVYEGTAPLRAYPTVNIEPADGRAAITASRLISAIDPATGQITPRGPNGEAFSIPGLKDGDYFLRVSNVGVLVKSVTINGDDYTDRPFSASAGDVSGAIVTLTDKSASISGVVRDRRGAPVTRGAVVIFPADRTLWTGFGFSPPRIRAVTFSSAAGYSVTRLPQGEYYLVAVDASQFEAWQDPRFFPAAASSAARVMLDWGQTRTQELTLAEVTLK